MNIRTATREAVGSNISAATSVEEALKISGLDYTVEKVPVFLEDGTPHSRGLLHQEGRHK